MRTSTVRKRDLLGTRRWFVGNGGNTKYTMPDDLRWSNPNADPQELAAEFRRATKRDVCEAVYSEWVKDGRRIVRKDIKRVELKEVQR